MYAPSFPRTRSRSHLDALLSFDLMPLNDVQAGCIQLMLCAVLNLAKNSKQEMMGMRSTTAQQLLIGVEAKSKP